MCICVYRRHAYIYISIHKHFLFLFALIFYLSRKPVKAIGVTYPACVKLMKQKHCEDSRKQLDEFENV